MAFNGIALWQVLPGAVERGGACHCGERQRSVVGEAVVRAGAEIRYGHPQRIAHAVPIGVGEVPQVEPAIVEDAVVAAGELHEAGDGAVVDDLRIAGNGAIGQRADAAVVGQGRGAAGRVQDDASGRQTKGAARPPVRSACQPPITDPPGAMLTVAFPLPVDPANAAAELSSVART